MDFPLITFNKDTGIAELGMPANPRPYRGIDKLVQIVVIAIFKNQQQDVFSPVEGSGLRALIGQFNYADPEEVQVEVLTRLKKVQDEIVQNQANTNYPSSEKLKELKVLKIVTDPISANTAVNIRVISEAGQSTDVVV